MKKISLKSIKTEELLSREELKQIMGGTGSGEDCRLRGYGSGAVGGSCCLTEQYLYNNYLNKVTCGLRAEVAYPLCDKARQDNYFSGTTGYSCYVSCSNQC